MARRSPGLLVALLLAACADTVPLPVEARIAQRKSEGDKAFSARNWNDAIGAYVNLFALLDPTPERSPQRAMVAFRIARAHVELARLETAELRARSLARYGRIWLREAIALQPDLYPVWFERAQLLELEPPSPKRDAALIEAYSAFLEGADKDAHGASAPARRSLAQTRLKELRE